MIKLKDLVWGEVDLVDENLFVDDSSADTNGQGQTVVMCCGGGGGGVDVPSIYVICPRPCILGVSK